MKKIILMILGLGMAMLAEAYDRNYAGCYKSVTLEYTSIDENNAPIVLSELVTIPLEKDKATYREVGFFLLTSMPFTTDKEQCPSGSMPMDVGLLRPVATEGAMVIQVDGEGFGSSYGRVSPFLINKLTARQAIDGFLAAMDYAATNGIKVNPDYYTLSVGYSRSGGEAVAVQRYLEKYADADVRSRVRLRKTICGGAPINATESAKGILQSRIRRRDITNTILKSMMEAYKEGCMHTVSMEDLVDANGNFYDDVVNGTSVAGRAFWKALAQEDMEKDWLPEAPIEYYHLASDNLVTYRNAEVALAAWGKDRFKIQDPDMTKKKWNVSVIRPVVESVNASLLKEDPHTAEAVGFMLGITDGCLRDTTLTTTYGAKTNFYDMLVTLFDITSGANKEIPLNLSTGLSNGKLTLKSIGNLHLTAELVGKEGNVSSIQVTLKPEALDSLAATSIKGVDAKGYLHIPVEFEVNIAISKSLSIPVSGTCKDLGQLMDQLAAIALHKTCPDAETAEMFCNALNQNLSMKATFMSLEMQVMASYTESWIDGTCTIEPYVELEGMSSTLDNIVSLFGISVSEYLSLDGKEFNLSGNKAIIHVVEREFGKVKLYADILQPDSTLMGRVDMTLTSVDTNETGTECSLQIDFSVNILKYRAKAEGSCNNLRDALLCAILCNNNLSCATPEEAQAYADAVNAQVNARLYVEKVGDTGEYGNYGYMDYGSLRAVVAQNEYGAYYVQYGLCWMNQVDVPLSAVLKKIIK